MKYDPGRIRSAKMPTPKSKAHRKKESKVRCELRELKKIEGRRRSKVIGKHSSWGYKGKM